MKTKMQKLIIALAWLALPALVQAQFTFTINNGAITITGYNTAAGLNAVIPAMTNGYPVTSIGDGAFENCTGLTSVTIPNSVTNIGTLAFFGCGLTSVTIGTNVTSIRLRAFTRCFSLTNTTVASANLAYSSLNGVLFDKSQAILLQFPGGLDGSYTIPNSVTTLGAYAFGYCSSLTSVTIPNSVTNIAAGAFYECSSLTSAYFLGNAPPDYGNAFLADPATVYYLTGATGWGPTFGSVPAVLWNPQANTFSFIGGRFGFNLTGPANAVIVVEACTNLSYPAWLPVSTNTLSSLGTSAFRDPSGYPMRYYRFRSP